MKYLSFVFRSKSIFRAGLTIIAYLIINQSLPAQQLQWGHSFGSVDRDEAKASATDKYGNLYVAGEFRGTIDFDPSSAQAILASGGQEDIFITKFNTIGDLVWAISISGAGDCDVEAIEVDENGNVIVAGRFRGTTDFDPSPGVASITSFGGGDVFFAKYNKDGRYQWAKRVGNNNSEIARGVATDKSGNIYLTGSFRETVDFDPSSGTAILTASGPNIFVAKYSPSGNHIWSFGIVSNQQQSSSDITIDKNGDIVLTGAVSWTADFDPSPDTLNLTTPDGAIDVFVAKYDSSGNIKWAFNVGGASTQYGAGLAIDSSNNIIITGYFSGRTDFDPSLSTNLITANGGSSDAFVAKYDQSGAHIWAFGLGGRIGRSGENGGNDVAVDAAGNVYVTGYFEDTADFDPSGNIVNIASAGSRDIFFAKYDATGNYVWAFPMGGSQTEMGRTVAVNSLGHAIVAGYSYDPIDFDPTTNSVSSSHVGQSDIFIASYSDEVSKECISIVSDSSWRKSTVQTPTNLFGGWSGVDGLPANSTFTETVSLEQPYGFPSIDEIQNTQVISSEHSITYYRKEFNLNNPSNFEVRLLVTVDDQPDIYLNGVRIALITEFGRSNYKFPAHDLKFGSNGSSINGFMGGDSYNYVANVRLDTVLKLGQNEIVIAVRNLGKATDKGGLSFRMDFNCNDTIINQKSSSTFTSKGSEVEVFPNPVWAELTVTSLVGIKEVRIFDYNGKIIFREVDLYQGSINLNLEMLVKGVYILEIEETDGNLSQEKLLKL